MKEKYLFLPPKPKWDLEIFVKEFKAKKVPEEFYYNSAQNTEWETVENLRVLIKNHVDQEFIF